MELKPGYKQTEVGPIPEDWNVKLLEEVTSITRLAGAEYSSVWEENDNGEIIALRGFNIGKNQIIEKDIVRITNELSLKLNRSRLYRGDVIYPCVGTIGNAVVIEENDKYHIQQNIAKITPEKNLSPYYLAYYLMSFLGLREVFRFNATSSQPNVLVGSLRKYRIPIPTTLEEQRAIASVLSDVDSLIIALNRLIAKKKDIKQAAMQKLLSGKKRLPGFSGEWKSKNIGDFTDCTAGGTPSTAVAAYWGGSIKWMNSGELNMRIIDDVEGRITEEGLKNSSTKMIPAKCVLIGLAGQGKTRGTVAMNMIEICTNQSIAAIFPNQTFIPEYLYYNLYSRYEELRRLSTGEGGRGGLNLSIIRSISVPLPEIDEQKAIAKVLSDIDTELTSLEQKRDKTKLLKQGMMQELLTGRIRLI